MQTTGRATIHTQGMSRTSHDEHEGLSLKLPVAQDDSSIGNQSRYRHLLWIIPVGIIVLDQVLKAIVVMWLGPDAKMHRLEIAGDLLAFEYLENTGAAFGMLPDQTEFLVAVSIVIVAACSFLMQREIKEHPLAAFAIAVVVGGAIGNMIDRIRQGYVVDYISVGGWPKFNIADSAITIGIALLFWSVIQDERAARKEQREHE